MKLGDNLAFPENIQQMFAQMQRLASLAAIAVAEVAIVQLVLEQMQ